MSIEDPNEVPEVWRPHFAAQRIEFTFRDLDRNVPGVALNTIRRALLGIGTPSRRVASAIAGALGISEEEFNATRAKVTGDTPTAPFTLPTSADLLNQRERDAVLSVVHALLDARDRHADQPTPASPPATPPRAPRPKDEKTRAGDKPACYLLLRGRVFPRSVPCPVFRCEMRSDLHFLVELRGLEPL